MTDEEYERFLAETWEHVHKLELARQSEYAAAPDRRFAIWRDLHELSSGALRQLAADFGAEVVGGDAGAMLASAGKDASILLGCLEAIGQKDAFLTYASERVDGLGARNPDLRPMLAYTAAVYL